MIARPNDTDGGSAFARTLLGVAAQVEADESAIKQAILAAARAGDCTRVIEIIDRWQKVPAAEVMESVLPNPGP